MSDAKQQLIKRLYETKEITDLVITFNSVPYHVHCLVLGIMSKYFEALFLSEQQDINIELDIPYISQDAFEHFLEYNYGGELDMKFVLPMLSFSSYFQCDELWQECQEYRLYNLTFSETHALHLFQYIISNFTLDETKKVIQDNLLVDCVIWFTVHFDKILELKVETLNLIPLEWLRYVFGKAVFHVFRNELDRLDKACQLYFKMGESKELFSVLFEGIRFRCIPLRDMCDEKYGFLYQSDNDIVLDKLLSPRISDMRWGQNFGYLVRNPSLVMSMHNNDTVSALAHNIDGEFNYVSTKGGSYLKFLVYSVPRNNLLNDRSNSLSAFIFILEDNTQSWGFHSFEFRSGHYWDAVYNFPIKCSSDPANVVFILNVLSLNIYYTG
jgi:hypothetical protein